MNRFIKEPEKQMPVIASTDIGVSKGSCTDVFAAEPDGEKVMCHLTGGGSAF